MFQYTPLLGAKSSSPASQSLIELDGGVKILVDVGWDEHFDVEKLKDLERHVPSLSIILLTHATPAHIAAFAHCCKHFPSFTQVPIYATSPVISLGRTLLQDIYSSTPLAWTVIPQSSMHKTSFSYQTTNSDEIPQMLLQPPTSSEIASYFALIHPLKYSQPHQPLPSPFSPSLNDLTITAYNAGHTLGGTIWHIQHGMESIVYAVDWNQVRENVFAGAAWLGGSGGGGAEVIEQLRKPTALVCSARGAEKIAMAGGRTKRDNLLLDTIRNAVAKGGTVLVPTDTSARVLELSYVLEHAWRKEASDSTGSSPLKSAKLYLASRNVGATMRYARSMLEWMDESVIREFESDSAINGNKQHKRGDYKQGANQAGNQQRAGKSNGPFEFRFLKLVENRKRVEKLISSQGSKVILASDTSLEWGFSKEILEWMANDSNNLIILTEDCSSASNTGKQRQGLKDTLWQWYREKKTSLAGEVGSDGSALEQAQAAGKRLHIKDIQRAALEGRELVVYQQYLATQRQNQHLSQVSRGTALESSAEAVDEASSSSSSSEEESDPEKQGRALNTTAKAVRFNRSKIEPSKEALGVNVLLQHQGVYDYDVRGKKGRDQMFPFVNKRRRADDFGELIKPEDYLRAEERDEIDGSDTRDHGAGKQEHLGQKRKWQETGMQGEKGHSGNSAPNKKRQRNKASANDVPLNGGDAVRVDGAGEDEELSTESESEGEDAIPGPAKLATRIHSVEAHLRIALVDFAGLHDQRSLSMLIPLIQPKKLVLVGGDASETAYLARDCQQKLRSETNSGGDQLTDFIFTPSIGQTVDASVDTNAWTVKLSEALTRRLHWQNVRGLGVVTLSGYLVATSIEPETPVESNSSKKLKMSKEDSEEAKTNDSTVRTETAPNLMPTLDILPANMAAATRSVAQPLYVGDLRLADLRKILQSTGHTAEFRGEGTLLIDGLVAIRKSSNGKIELEDGGLNIPNSRIRSLEGSFYAVKRKIYDGLAVIAGG
ncbi:MAG: hypothetical protein Q9217_006085 [Psora testacea]